jgi:hypothetical protein
LRISSEKSVYIPTERVGNRPFSSWVVNPFHERLVGIEDTRALRKVFCSQKKEAGTLVSSANNFHKELKYGSAAASLMQKVIVLHSQKHEDM